MKSKICALIFQDHINAEITYRKICYT